MKRTREPEDADENTPGNSQDVDIVPVSKLITLDTEDSESHQAISTVIQCPWRLAHRDVWRCSLGLLHGLVILHGSFGVGHWLLSRVGGVTALSSWLGSMALGLASSGTRPLALTVVLPVVLDQHGLTLGIDAELGDSEEIVLRIRMVLCQVLLALPE